MLRRPCLLLLFATSGTLAQTKAPEPLVHAQFRVLSIDGPILGAGYLEGKNLRRIDISGDAFTAEQNYRGPNPLRLVLTKAAPPSTDRLMAQQTHQAIRARLEVLTRELQEHEAKALKASRGEDGGGRKLAKSARPPGTTDRTAEILKEMEALQARLLALEAQLNQASIPRSEEPEPDAEKTKPGITARDDKSPTHTPLADVTLPGDGRYLILIQQTATGATTNIVDDREGVFPFGAMQFINLTGKTVEVRFGPNHLHLASKDKGTLRAPAANRNYASGQIYTQEADGLQPAYSMRTFQQDDVRTLFFLLAPTEGRKGVQLKGIEERRPDQPITPEAPGKDAPAR